MKYVKQQQKTTKKRALTLTPSESPTQPPSEAPSQAPSKDQDL